MNLTLRLANRPLRISEKATQADLIVRKETRSLVNQHRNDPQRRQHRDQTADDQHNGHEGRPTLASDRRPLRKLCDVEKIPASHYLPRLASTKVSVSGP